MDEFVVESLIKNEINSRKHIDKNDQLGMIFDKSDRQSELIQLKFCDEFVNEAIYCAKQLINEEIDHLDFLRSQSSGITQYYKNFKIEDKLQNPAYNRMENFLKALDSSYFAKEYDNWRHLFNEKHKTNFLTGINEALEELWLKRKITGTCELGKSLISIFEDIELPFELLDYLKSTFQEFEYDYTSYLTKVLNNMPEEFDDLQHQTWKNFTSVIKRLTYLTPDSEATPQGIKEIVRFISAEPKVFHSVDGKSIFVTGFRYKISECLEKVENLITDEVALVKFFSFAAIVLDCNISGNKWHSKNLVFYAEKIIISKNVVVDLSGRNGGDVNDRAADSDGKKDGTDGIDGAAGKNSGNVVFYINEKPKNEEKLTIILNGGNGGKGQDGGHGTNGRNGAYVRREDFEKKIKDVEPEKFNDAESLTGLFGSFIWVVEQTDYNGLKGIDYREGYDENGIHCIVSLSKTFLYTFCYMVLKGSKAKSSTKGGRGGQGGQGGHRGIFQVYIRNNDKNFPIELSSVIVTAVDGIEGKPGAGGNNGKLVKD
uniref:Obg domain-containing protein n=1 Tax=Acrobeloides nanus TaxID=290746 RepID=A0A914ED22_9BILA